LGYLPLKREDVRGTTIGTSLAERLAAADTSVSGNGRHSRVWSPQLRVWTWAAQEKRPPREGAAKFREETPKKGGGRAERISVMPRCSNMAVRRARGKHQTIRICEETRWYYTVFLLKLSS